MVDAAAQWAVVEEEAGVEVVVQVHEQCCRAFAHREVFAACRLFLVLGAAALALAGFEDEVGGGDFEDLRDDVQRVQEAFARFFRGDGFRRRVFLYVDVVAIDVHRDGVFGHVLVVHAVGVSLCRGGCFHRGAAVFAQAVGEHARLFVRRRGGVVRLSFAFVLFAAQVEGDLRFDAAVVRLVGFVALQVQAFQEVGVAADDRHLPVGGEGFVGGAECVVGADEFAQGAEAFAVGRVGDDEAARAVAGLGGEAGKFAPLQVQAVAEVKAGGVVARAGKGCAVVVVAPDFEVKTGEPCFAPCHGFFVEAFPHRRFVALPAVETKALPFEGGGDVGRHQ